MALTRIRLRRTAAGRFAGLTGVLVAAGLAVAALILRSDGGASAPLEGLLGTGARWLLWLAAAPIALAAAEDRRARDRQEGLEALAAARGLSSSALAAAHVLGAMAEIARALALPLGALAVLLIALAGTVHLALTRLGLAAGVLLFTGIAGVTLGGLGAAAGRIGRARGRWLLAAIVLGPWMLADLAGLGAWSIPGALGAVLDFVLRAAGAPA